MDDKRPNRHTSEQAQRRAIDRGTLRAGLGMAIGAAVVAAASLAIAQTSPPLPETVSAEGRAALAEWAKGPQVQLQALTDLAARRAFFNRHEDDFGARQQRRYPVDVSLATVARVPVRLIRAKAPPAKGNLILINFHGGGFQVDTGSLTENIPIAAITKVPVVAVLYRLSPEHSFPSAVEDGLAVYRELLKTHKPSEIGIYGTSAGAVLGPELIARIRKERLPQPAVLGVFSGDADLSKTGDSLASSTVDTGRLYRAYAGATPVTDPSISPALGAVDFFPPTLCISSSRDFLLSSTANFCRKLELSGVENKLVVFDALPHGFWDHLDMPESDQAFAIMAKFLTAHLASPHRP
jgi:monoterpene epsilon-lactone hydrolase